MSVVLAFKICSTKSVVLAHNEINLINVIPNIKKHCIEKHIEPIKYLVDIILSSNAYAFIEVQKTK